MPDWIIVLGLGLFFSSLGGLCICSALSSLRTPEDKGGFSGTPGEKVFTW